MKEAVRQVRRKAKVGQCGVPKAGRYPWGWKGKKERKLPDGLVEADRHPTRRKAKCPMPEANGGNTGRLWRPVVLGTGGEQRMDVS